MVSFSCAELICVQLLQKNGMTCDFPKGHMKTLQLPKLVAAREDKDEFHFYSKAAALLFLMGQ